MKTLVNTMLAAGLLTLISVVTTDAQSTAPKANSGPENKKLEGRELAKMYLQKILEDVEGQTDDATEQEELLKKLRSLVGRVETSRQQELAKQPPAAQTPSTAMSTKEPLQPPAPKASPIAVDSQNPVIAETSERVVVRKPAVVPAGATSPVPYEPMADQDHTSVRVQIRKMQQEVEIIRRKLDLLMQQLDTEQ